MIAARRGIDADLDEASDLVRRRDRANLGKRVFEERGLFVQSPGEAQRLCRCPHGVRQDLAIARLPCDRNGLLELPFRLRDVVEDRDRRRSPYQKTHELGARPEGTRRIDRAIELVHCGEVRVQPKLDDRAEGTRRCKLRGWNAAAGADR